jgi:hypothetical protein
VFSVAGTPRLYNEDPRPVETELRKSLEMALEDDRGNGKKGIRLCKEDFTCAAVTVRLL